MKKHIFRGILAFLSLYAAVASAQSDKNLLVIARAIAKPEYIGKEEDQLYLSPEEQATASYIPLLQEAIGEPGDTTVGQLLDRMTGNPFLSRGGEPALIWILADAQTALGAVMSRSSLPQASAPGFRVTTVADGIAKFLVTRAKEELSIAFFRQFKEDVANNPHLKQLFPTTAATLNLVDKQVYQFNRYLDALRESFVRDFKVMPTNLNAYLKDRNIIQNTAHQLLAEEALELSQFIISGSSPEEILDYLSMEGPLQNTKRIMGIADTAVRSQFVNMSAGFQTAGMLSHSLYSGNGGFLEPGKVSDYLSDAHTRTIYMALLWQHAQKIRFSDGSNLRDYLGKLAINPQLLEDFTALVEKLSNDHKKAGNAALASRESTGPEGSMEYEPYFQFFSAMLDLFETGVEVKKSVASLRGQSTNMEDSLFLGIRHLNDLNFDIRQKHYAAAINDLMYVLRVFYPTLDEGVRGKIFNYGQFIATVATAQNSDEVAAAIDAVALPPGSSRVKKQNDVSAAINAYIGGTFGLETLSDGSRNKVLALSAPVGFTVSWKFNQSKEAELKGNTPGSFSLFAPIIDVGALAAYRLNDPYSNDLPELAWSNLLSPGLYGVLGFPNDLPISVGLGAQRGPNLRTITRGTQTNQLSGWRYGVFFSVDIPVFNLFIQNKKEKY